MSVGDSVFSVNIHCKQDITQILPDIHSISVRSQCACECFCGVEFGEFKSNLPHDARKCKDDVTFLVNELNPEVGGG